MSNEVSVTEDHCWGRGQQGAPGRCDGDGPQQEVTPTTPRPGLRGPGSGEVELRPWRDAALPQAQWCGAPAVSPQLLLPTQAFVAISRWMNLFRGYDGAGSEADLGRDRRRVPARSHPPGVRPRVSTLSFCLMVQSRREDFKH